MASGITHGHIQEHILCCRFVQENVWAFEKEKKKSPLYPGDHINKVTLRWDSTIFKSKDI